MIKAYKIVVQIINISNLFYSYTYNNLIFNKLKVIDDIKLF